MIVCRICFLFDFEVCNFSLQLFVFLICCKIPLVYHAAAFIGIRQDFFKLLPFVSANLCWVFEFFILICSSFIQFFLDPDIILRFDFFDLMTNVPYSYSDGGSCNRFVKTELLQLVELPLIAFLIQFCFFKLVFLDSAAKCKVCGIQFLLCLKGVGFSLFCLSHCGPGIQIIRWGLWICCSSIIVFDVQFFFFFEGAFINFLEHFWVFEFRTHVIHRGSIIVFGFFIAPFCFEFCFLFFEGFAANAGVQPFLYKHIVIDFFPVFAGINHKIAATKITVNL